MTDVRYEIDPEDRIRSVNPEWSLFARENGGEELSADRVIGTSIWDWVSGAEVQHLYRLLFSRLRDRGGSARLPFRCDSPEARRFMELDVSALPNRGLVCSASLRREERRAPLALLDPTVSRSGSLLVLCSWCKCVRADGRWLEIEDAIVKLGLLSEQPPPLTHTICAACADRVGKSG